MLYLVMLSQLLITSVVYDRQKQGKMDRFGITLKLDIPERYDGYACSDMTETEQNGLFS